MFRSRSTVPPGPVVPVSTPPWPGSSTIVAAPMVSPAWTTAVRAHGVMTFHAPGPPPSIGRTNPFGVASTLGASLCSAGSDGGGFAVVVVGAVDVVVVVDVVDGDVVVVSKQPAPAGQRVVVVVAASFDPPPLHAATSRSAIAAAQTAGPPRTPGARCIRVP